MESDEYRPIHFVFVSLNLKYKGHAKAVFDLTSCNCVNRQFCAKLNTPEDIFVAISENVIYDTLCRELWNLSDGISDTCYCGIYRTY